MKSAIQELTDEVKKVKPMGVPLDLEYDYDYYIEMDKNNTCLFLDWIHAEGWKVFKSTPEILWFKEGAFGMMTNKQLYNKFYNITNQ